MTGEKCTVSATTCDVQCGQSLKWKLLVEQPSMLTFVRPNRGGPSACREPGSHGRLVNIPMKTLEDRQNLDPLNEKHTITGLSCYKEATRGLWGNKLRTKVSEAS